MSEAEPTYALPKRDLDALLAVMRNEGYEVYGPTPRDGAVMYDRIERAAELPVGLRDEQSPGRYRLRDRGDGRYFGVTLGPDSPRRLLLPPTEVLYRAERRPDGRIGFTAEPLSRAESRRAIVGVRQCDLAAIRVQDRVQLGGEHSNPRYRTRRDETLLVGVDCDEPGDLCFCVSAGIGPEIGADADLRLTELDDVFLLRAQSERGRALIDRLALRDADESELNTVATMLADAKARIAGGGTALDMGRAKRLFDVPNHERWEDVAARCLSCGSCTSVCPTCFCTTGADQSDVGGAEARRTERWESCFSGDHARIHGADPRPNVRDRYQQWLTHKLSTWEDQFDSAGCVGCARCITWCPAEIDITAEARAMTSDLPASTAPPLPPARSMPVGEADDLMPNSAEVLSRHRETHDVVTLTLPRAEDAPPYAPGQFSMLSLPRIGECAISVSRVREDEVEHTIRAVGAVSRALAELRTGDCLGTRGPYGRAWPMNEAEGRGLVVVAGGVGIAPMRPTIEAVVDAPERYGSLRIFYGARRPDELLFEDDAEGWAAHTHVTLDRTVDHASADWTGPVGVVTRLLRWAPLAPESAYFVCGPEVMMRFSAATLIEAGVPAERIWVSMERHMKCAVARCGRCQYGPHLICRDGPVFRFDAVAKLLHRHGI